MRHVTVLGAGASGTLVALNLAARAAHHRAPLTIQLVDPAPLAAGPAFGTPDRRHRVNVRAAKMSARADDPSHFVRWLDRMAPDECAPAGFVPRPTYHRYLVAALQEQVERARPYVSLRRISGRAVALRALAAGRIGTVLDAGPMVVGDALVLALGNGTADDSWVPDALRSSPRFVADPWAGRELPAARTAVLVGAGLTMADVALSLGAAGATLTVVSRTGLEPLAHAPTVEVATPSLPPGPLGYPQARHLVFDHLRRSPDWRSGLDALRPVTAELWRRLTPEARETFLRVGVRRWDRARHRLAPAVADRLADLRTDGRFEHHRGHVVDVAPTADGIEVRLADGRCLAAEVVVNCTGRGGDRPDPFVTSLFVDGWARPGPHGLGLATDADGSVRGPRGEAPLWTLGAQRRGELWESTAIPEISRQAAEVATAICDRVLAPADTVGV
jgi:uncharacterized NAD(P)/FAD-binding protein YdhS